MPNRLIPPSHLAAAIRCVVVPVLVVASMATTPALAQSVPDGQQRQNDQQQGSQSGASRDNTDSQNQNQNQNGSTASGAQFNPVDITPRTSANSADDMLDKTGKLTRQDLLKLRPPAEPGEFETYLAKMTGRKIKRFGADLLLPALNDYTVPSALVIPPDYPIGVGDTIAVNLTGSVTGSVEFAVDPNGKIFLPQIGEVSVVGVRYRDLKAHISAAIGQQYRGYDVSVSIKKLHGIRVYVTGFARAPGVYTVNSLATVVNALFAAGGPNAGGSLRSAKLYRNGREVQDFDLYDILRHGNRSRDPILENEDVLFIPQVGQQVAVIGSANEEAVYELRGKETLADVVALAGGPSQLADPDRVIIYRLEDKDTIGSREISRSDLTSRLANGGDIIEILPNGSLARPIERQSVLVRIEGEVARPGNYFVTPGTTAADVIASAGGLTSRAFVYGTVLVRATVREQQRESFRAAIDQLEQMINAAALTNYSQTNGADRDAQLGSARALLAKLRSTEPDGRLVMNLGLDARALPEGLVLENNDRILVPPRVDTVGVFGAVYRPASFLLEQGKPIKLGSYIDSAGGVQRSADKGSIFVVHANGAVETKRKGALAKAGQPGDVVFVPTRTQASTLFSKIKDIFQIVFQVGVTAAAIAAIR